MSRTRRVFEFDGEVQKKPEPEKPIEVPKVEKPAAKKKPDVCYNCDGAGFSGKAFMVCKVCGGTGLGIIKRSELAFQVDLPPKARAKILFLYQYLPTKFSVAIQEWAALASPTRSSDQDKAGNLVFDMLRANGYRFYMVAAPLKNGDELWELSDSSRTVARLILSKDGTAKAINDL